MSNEDIYLLIFLTSFGVISSVCIVLIRSPIKAGMCIVLQHLTVGILIYNLINGPFWPIR